MNIVVPMAGRGERFKKEGMDLPKMMIDVLGKPMLYWALESLKFKYGLDRIIFICLKEHINRYPVEQLIHTYCTNPKIVILDEVANGQAHSVFMAKNIMNLNEPLVIYNCDTYTELSSKDVEEKDIDGIISVFQSEEDELSYVKANDNGFVLEIQEKKRISKIASTGLYHFSKASMFIDSMEEILHECTNNGEHYVGPLYNSLIKKGYKFAVREEKKCFPLGTPKQLKIFIDQFKYISE
ncbi:sugar phosphate nucleotidyltransferase [Cytobacillus pseudoceanisediminis]|uniref:sugar phosphate nucleotidyltransferase n=1 Tax=Cytobacillus pseudoceanisediminis TaxID=3051614 RepID=UPI003C2EE9F0